MKAPSRRSVVMAVTVVVIVAAVSLYMWWRIASPLVLNAPPPRVFAGPLNAVPKMPESTIEALVTYNLGTALESLEVAVPRTYGDIEHRLPIASNTRASFGYTVSRTPFRAEVVGQTLALSADVEYQARVWYRPPIGPELSTGCGVGDEPRPRVRVRLVSAARLTQRWNLLTHTSVQRLEPFSDGPRDRCRMTVLRLDVTPRVIKATRAMLDEKLAKFDGEVSRWPVRARFVRLWELLQRPIFLTEGVYLEINPYSAELGSVGAVGDSVTARLRMIASPRVVTSVRTDSIRPLPMLGVASDIGSGAHVVVEASFTYPVATALLRRSLVGRSLVQEGRLIRIRDIQIMGLGDGRVALGVTLSGRVRGKLYFTGTPSFDPRNRQISVPDLDYDVGTEQMLVQGVAWLRGVDILNFLRDRARLPDSATVGRLRGLAQTGINRTLAEGVTLSGRIHGEQGTSVIATTEEIRLRAVADAEFKLSIDRGPSLPRPPQTAKVEHK